MRRRPPEPGERRQPPSWLVKFDIETWSEPWDDPPAGWEFGSWRWREFRARDRWEAAGREWLAENGWDRSDWYRLVYADREVVHPASIRPGSG